MATLDEIYADISPFPGEIRSRDKKRLNKLVESFNLKQGKLYILSRPTAWIFGHIDDPVWVGNRDKPGEYVFATDKDEPVIYLGHVYINWIDSHDNRKYWISTLQFVVRDKAAYMPIAPGLLQNPELQQEFLEQFILAEF